MGHPMANFQGLPALFCKVLQDESAIIEALWQST